jgi:hypothetical protein
MGFGSDLAGVPCDICLWDIVEWHPVRVDGQADHG